MSVKKTPYQIIVEYDDGYSGFVDGWVVYADTAEVALMNVRDDIARRNAVSKLLFDVEHWRIVL